MGMRSRPSASEGLRVVEYLFGAGAAGVAVGDQSDTMAPGDLFLRQVQHVPEQAADRRAHDVDDIQRFHRSVWPEP